MPPSRGPVVSPSLKFAVLAVDVVWYLSILASALGIVSALVVAVSPHIHETLVRRRAIFPGTTFSLPLRVEYSRTAPASPANGPASSLKVIGHDDVILEKPFERADVAWWLPVRVLTAAIVLWMLFQLRALLHSVKRGHPFDSRNPVRMRRIGYVVIATGLLGSVAEWLRVAAWFGRAIPLVKGTLPGASASYYVSFDWKAIFVGLIIVAIGHAFDAGARLQNDQDLTV